MELIQIVEAQIFASPSPITVPDIAKAIRRAVDEAEETTMALQNLAQITVGDVAVAIDDLIAQYQQQNRPMMLMEGPSGWRFVTRPEYAEWVRALIPGLRPERLSPPALETLAIIAYRQPITKADIEAVRGVAVDGVLQKVIDRGLIKIGGRADLPGRPMMYETTDLFLEHFGVKQLDDLPNAQELRKIDLPTATPEEEPPEVEQLKLKGIVKDGTESDEAAPSDSSTDEDGEAASENENEAPEDEESEEIPETEESPIEETDESDEEDLSHE